jgi:small GTP-binding protein
VTEPVKDSAILLTPRPSAGGAAIAVVRLRGPRVGEFLGRFFSKTPVVGKCVHGELRDGRSIIDDVVIIYDGGLADICLHGGAWVVESALKLARREGFAIIESSVPLPMEAVDDAVDELEREVLQYLPLALTEIAIRMLLNQPMAWRQSSKIDLAAIANDKTLWRLLHPPKIAIVGPPNVGKSTLANRLFGQQRSITADVPGTTRDWVGEMADIGGLPAMLIDTPGLRQTDDAIERSAIAASREQVEEADLLIAVIDATGRRPDHLQENSQRQIVAINKIDQPASWDVSRVNAVRISAKTGQGCDELCRAIHAALGIENLDINRPRWWTDRQRQILLGANGDREAAIEAIINRPTH